jgi:septal ring factor EnvC (AmiA/AmiB activator)
MAIHDIITDGSGAYIQRGSWNSDTRVTRHNLPEIYGRPSQTVAATNKKVSQIKSDIIESLRDPSNRMKKRRDSIEQDLNKNSQEINDINAQLVGKKSESELQKSIVDLQTLHSTPEYTNRLTDFGTKKTEL